MFDEVGGTDDDAVGDQHDPSVADVAVFVDYHGDDIRTAGTAALHEHETDAEAGHAAAEECREEFVVC